MKIIICGAGQVGSSIARQLANEHNDVTIIDQEEGLIQRIGETLDVRAIKGHAAHPAVLASAGAEDADMIIAVTFSDEINMVACQVAHSIFNVPTKIARVRSQQYLHPKWKDLFSIEHLPIDVIISPELEVAKAVIRRLHVPGAFDMLPFADGEIKAVAVHCVADSPVNNLPIKLIKQRANSLCMNIMGVVRDDEFRVPNDKFVLEAGDDVYFIVQNKDLKKTMALFGHEEREARKLVIVGGGNIGLYIAEALEQEEEDVRIKVIELGRERAEFIDGKLDDATVILGSALDQEILEEAGIAQTETIIAVTNDDEVNVLASLLAKRYGAERSITLINNLSYVPLLGNLGIDAIVNPRETTVSTILQHLRRGKIRSVHSIMDGAAEIMEAEVVETSPLVGKTIPMLDLPKGIIIGMLQRNGEVMVPDDETIFHNGDRLILLASSKVVKKVEKYFSVSLEFF